MTDPFAEINREHQRRLRRIRLIEIGVYGLIAATFLLPIAISFLTTWWRDR